tara:strand:+ start:7463 stop:7942 length:480 start_codon:yes stop_codon:yes gene_type:complete
MTKTKKEPESGPSVGVETPPKPKPEKKAVSEAPVAERDVGRVADAFKRARLIEPAAASKQSNGFGVIDKVVQLEDDERLVRIKSHRPTTLIFYAVESSALKVSTISRRSSMEISAEAEDDQLGVFVRTELMHAAHIVDGHFLFEIEARGVVHIEAVQDA